REEGPVRLSDVARVSDAAEEQRNIVLIEGAPGIRLTVRKLDGANTVDVSKRLREEVRRLDEDMPDVSLSILTDTAEFIEDSISSVKSAALVGGLLAVLVLLLFLGEIRATLVIATAIPISVIGTFALMDFAGITLNIVSFGGLALGIGMLVDSAIVILENIFRHRAQNPDLDPTESAIEGSREVSSAVTASTLTTLTVFVPVIFLGGFVGVFFGQLALVVVFSLACALLVALTLVPMLAGRLPRGKSASKGSGPILRRLVSAYCVFVAWLMRRKWVAIMVALVMVGGAYGMVAAGLVSTELMPETDEGTVSISVEMPPGTRLEVTKDVIDQVEARVRQAVPELDVLFTAIGPRGPWSSAGGNYGSLNLRLVDLEERSRSSAEIAAALRPLLMSIPDAKIRVRPGGGLWIFRMLRGGGDRLQVDIRGYDLETGADLAQQVVDIMRSVEGVADAQSSRELGGAELAVHVDWERASSLGVSPAAVGQAIQRYVLGTTATYLREGGDEYRVVVRLAEQDRRYIEQMLDLPLFIPGGGQVPIRSVARVEEQAGALSIQREGQERVINVTGTLDGEHVDLGAVSSEVERRINSEIIEPPGFHLEMGGESREQERTFGGLLIGFVLALALVYMVMAAQFESLVQPFIIMFAVPLASIGVTTALVVTGTSFNMYSFLGVIVLVGIVVNNAIVLVDYMNLLRREKRYEVVAAVVEGTRRRLRPIIMTTATTCLALVPVALGMGEGGDLNAPLARVVVGGLLSSAVVSLVVVPAIYGFIEERRARREQRKAARAGALEAEGSSRVA
ncbi:MAG: efflux RND transporter permease subunit, partial [Myxococcota bacterium]